MGLLSTFIKQNRQERSERGPADRFRRGNCVMFPAGAGESYLSVGGQNWLVPESVARFVMECGEFKTSDAHVSGSADADLVREWLPQLFEIRALITEETFVRALNEPLDFTRRILPIHAVGIISNGSIVEVLDTLRSFGSNAERYYRALEFTVFGADTHEDACAQYRAVASDLNLTVRLVGNTERSRFVSGLAEQSGLSPEIAGLALGNGSEWSFVEKINAAILYTPRRNVLCIVAGTSGDMLAKEGETEGVSFSASPDECTGAGTPVDHDFFSLHERYLGRRLGECLPGHGGKTEVSLGYADADVLDRLETCNQRIIATTQPWHALATRKVQFSLNLGKSPVVGLNAAEFIPPFLPGLHSYGAAFSTLMRKCLPGAWIAHLPFSILSESDDPSPHSNDQHGVTCLLSHLVESSSVVSESPEFAMECVGRRLVDVSRLPEEPFRILIARCATELLLPEVSSSSRDWVREELLSDAPGMRWEGQKYERGASLRELIAGCGQLLIHWPAIVRAAGKQTKVSRPIWITP